MITSRPQKEQVTSILPTYLPSINAFFDFVKLYSYAPQLLTTLYIFSLDKTVSTIYIVCQYDFIFMKGETVMAIGIYYRMVSKSGNSYKVGLPIEIRRALNIFPRDTLEITTHGDEILMRKANPSFTERKLK